MLFAKIHPDSSDPETITIIRVRTFVAPKLQTDVLLPVTGLADEVTFRAPHASSSEPNARLRIKDVNGDDHYLSSTSDGGVFPVSLEPLTKQEVERYRALFPPETSLTAVFAVVPRDAPCRERNSEDTKQNAATSPSPRRETALPSEKAAAPTHGEVDTRTRGETTTSSVFIKPSVQAHILRMLNIVT